MENEIPKYKKMKNNKSKSSKKAKHAHNYIPCILHTHFANEENNSLLQGGWYDTGKVCTICGKTKFEYYSGIWDVTWLPVFPAEDDLRARLSKVYPDIKIETIETKWNGERIE